MSDIDKPEENRDLVKAGSHEVVDGFEFYTDEIEGVDHEHNNIIQGLRTKFTNEARWELKDGEDLAGIELVAVNVVRVVQRWENQRPIETRILAPGEKFPDVKALNDAVPKSEWVEGPNGLRGPWQAQLLVYLLNPQTMDRYTFPTGTVGGTIAVRDLVEKINWMRRFRGAYIYPVVLLSDTFMKTRFGGRQRPHFVIKRWVNLGDAAGDKVLPAPNAPPTQPAGAHEVRPPTLHEELNDELPDSLK